MDEIERLTSYLDGGLAADERRALEAELAGDSALRARLEALRAADAALEQLPATELPEGARQRLDARLSGVLAEVLAAEPAAPVPLRRVAGDAPTSLEATEIAPDRFTARRRRRALPALTGVAAGLVLLAGGVIGLGQTGLLSGGDDELASGATEADMNAESAPAPEALLPPDAGAAPVVIDEGRTTTVGELDELLDRPELQELARRSLPAEDGELVAAEVQQELLGDIDGADAGGTGAEADGSAAAEEEAEAEARDEADDQAGAEADRSPAAPPDDVILTRDGQVLPPADAADVRRCLTALLEAGTQAIPTTIELIEVDGVPAIAYGLVTLDPETGAFTRSEVWTVERDGCQVVRFNQS